MRGLGNRTVLRGGRPYLSGLRRRNMGTGCALGRPHQSADHVPGDTAAESDDEHLEPFPHHDPTVIFASYQPIPKSGTALSRTARTAPRSTALPTKKNGLQGVECPPTVAV